MLAIFVALVLTFIATAIMAKLKSFARVVILIVGSFFSFFFVAWPVDMLGGPVHWLDGLDDMLFLFPGHF